MASPNRDRPRRRKAILKKRARFGSAPRLFVAAFDKGDAKALAALWAPDGDYIDQTGRHLIGREAIEDGATGVMPAAGGLPRRARYTLVHIKQGGQWQLANVREAAYAPPWHYEDLRQPEWLIGDWSSAGETAETARMSFTCGRFSFLTVNTA